MTSSRRLAAAGPAREALRAFADAEGRSVLARVRMGGHEWVDGVAAEVVRPAASLLKMALGLAAERALADGTLDPSGTVPAGAIDGTGRDGSVTALLDRATALSPGDLLGLLLGASDNAAARWFAQRIPATAVQESLREAGCTDTTLAMDPESAWVLEGTTTCADALRLLATGSDETRYPRCAHALRHSIRNSRIPLGAQDADIRIAHKTGTMTGLAHDVALLQCRQGSLEIAFLTERQHDTLVAGYAMGVCTRSVLEAWGLSVHRTVSIDGS